MRLRGSSVRVAYYHGGKKLSAMVNTIASHVENMITGVTKGFRYNMRLVYAHFPIDTTITTKEGRMHLDIRNFLGGKKSQHITMGEGVEITKSEFVKDELILEGNSIEEVSQSAASIQQSLSIKGKDLRKFLDGIYVSQKGFVVE
ncbi:60S ribosomal protein L9B [Bonamia ostreae]|uniref:60S ribosomal protein L9B n=1 Tax=Bonamia ostreae TaxID=126728 RepID=A0ABV2AIU7_9EUKA